MAQVPKDDVKELWNETPRHDWSNFRKTLEKHRGQKDSIEDSVITVMLQAIQDLEKSGQNYPESFEMFYEVINQKVEAGGKSPRNAGEGRAQGREKDSEGSSSRSDGEARKQARDSGERSSRSDGEVRKQSRGSGEHGSRGDGEGQSRGTKK